jgi:hypothetical protein
MTIEERVASLEKSVRGLRVLAIALGLAAVLAVGGAATQGRQVPAMIEAQNFTLCDSQGNVRGVWAVDPDEGASFNLYGEPLSGKKCAGIVMNANPKLAYTSIRSPGFKQQIMVRAGDLQNGEGGETFSQADITLGAKGTPQAHFQTTATAAIGSLKSSDKQRGTTVGVDDADDDGFLVVTGKHGRHEFP